MQTVRIAPRPFVQAKPVSAPRVVAARAHPMDPAVNWQQFKRHDKDVGSTEVQIAQLTARVSHLTQHLQANRKDYACVRGLQTVLGQRKALLQYLYKEDKQAFANIVRELGIRNPIKSVVLK